MKEIEKIEKQIQLKVQQYVNAQKRYNGDSALSKRIEMQIDTLECKQKELKKNNYEEEIK